MPRQRTVSVRSGTRSAVEGCTGGTADLSRSLRSQRADSVNEHRLRERVEVVERGYRGPWKAFWFGKRKLAGNPTNACRDRSHEYALHGAIRGVSADDEERPALLVGCLAPPHLTSRYHHLSQGSSSIACSARRLASASSAVESGRRR